MSGENEIMIPMRTASGDKHALCLSGTFEGWICWKHPDGQWVSAAKASEDQIAYARAIHKMNQSLAPEASTPASRRFDCTRCGLTVEVQRDGLAQVGSHSNCPKCYRPMTEYKPHPPAEDSGPLDKSTEIAVSLDTNRDNQGAQNSDFVKRGPAEDSAVGRECRPLTIGEIIQPGDEAYTAGQGPWIAVSEARIGEAYRPWNGESGMHVAMRRPKAPEPPAPQATQAPSEIARVKEILENLIGYTQMFTRAVWPEAIANAAAAIVEGAYLPVVGPGAQRTEQSQSGPHLPKINGDGNPDMEGQQ